MRLVLDELAGGAQPEEHTAAQILRRESPWTSQAWALEAGFRAGAMPWSPWQGPLRKVHALKPFSGLQASLLLSAHPLWVRG